MKNSNKPAGSVQIEDSDTIAIPDSKVENTIDRIVHLNLNDMQIDQDQQTGLRIFQSLRRIIRGVDIHSKRLLAEFQITGPQLVCLQTIYELAPITSKALANNVHLSPSTIVGILDRLEGKGLIQRNRDRKDRRMVQISLTDQGKQLMTESPSSLQDTFETALQKLPEVERLQIARSLDRVVEMMEIGNLDAAPILETGPINPSKEVKK